MSHLTGWSTRPVVFIGAVVGGSPRLCRILRVGRPGRWFLLEQPLVGHRDYVAYYGWVALAGGSYWNSRWWVTAIMSHLTGGSPRPVVLIGTATGGSPRLCRILRVGRPGRFFLLEQPLVGHRDYVASYGWVALVGSSYWTSRWWVTAIMSHL